MSKPQRFLSRSTGILIFLMLSLLLITQNSSVKVANFLLADSWQLRFPPPHQTLLLGGFLLFGLGILGFFCSIWRALWLWQHFESKLTLNSLIWNSPSPSRAIAGRYYNHVSLIPPRESLPHPGYRLLGQRHPWFSSAHEDKASVLLGLDPFLHVMSPLFWELKVLFWLFHWGWSETQFSWFLFMTPPLYFL